MLTNLPLACDLKAHFFRTAWQVDPASASPMRAALVRAMWIVFAVARDLGEGQLCVRAMSLVYSTLLSLVPLLATSFSVLKSFGVHNQVEPLLLNFLSPSARRGSRSPSASSASSRTSRWACWGRWDSGSCSIP